MELFAGPGSAAAGLLRGQRDTRAPMLYTLIGHWVVGAPLGLYLCEVQRLGITGVWIGLAAGTLLSTLLTLRRLIARRGGLSIPTWADGRPTVSGTVPEAARR